MIGQFFKNLNSAAYILDREGQTQLRSKVIERFKGKCFTMRYQDGCSVLNIDKMDADPTMVYMDWIRVRDAKQYITPSISSFGYLLQEGVAEIQEGTIKDFLGNQCVR